ncbi:unnamed protein product [Closterium sp. NIES-65]|nr:unnamed protein product [Closterium sp. NIES-65]
MVRQAPPQRGTPLLVLLLLTLIVSATVAVAQDAFDPVTYVPATHSLTFGLGYIASVNTATNPPSLAVVDSTCAPVAPTSNADGSSTVVGYTAYSNGTITGPGGLSIYIGAGDALAAMGTTTVLKNGTIVDGSGMKLVPATNPDGSYTAGDMTGWANSTIVGSGGAVINAGAPLTLTADGSIAFALHAAPPVPSAAISVNPGARSLSVGGYTVSLSGNKLSLLDSTGKPVTTTTNPDGSRCLGDYTLYKNGTIAAPGGIAIDTSGPNAGLRVGTTTVLTVNGTVLDGTGAKIVLTGPNEDGSVTLASPSLPTATADAPSAGVASPPTGAASPPTDVGAPPSDAGAPTADVGAPPAGSTSPPAGASTHATPPPPPKTAGSLASPATALAAALITLALAPLIATQLHAAMARKRKTAADATTDVPRDLNEITYIAWINKQIASGRKPAGPMPEGIPSPGATSYEAPRNVPTRGHRDGDRIASSRVIDDNPLDDDSDYNKYAVGTDDEADSGEEPDKGMSDSEDDGEGKESEDEADAPEETQPSASTTRAGRATLAGTAKTASKGGEPPRRVSKTRNQMPVKRSVWSPLESTIFVAARWFMKDELEPLLGKQGSQYWARLVKHFEKENPGWVRSVNAVQKQWRNLVKFYKQLKKGEKALGKGAVCKPSWYPYMELYCNNRAVANPHAVAGGGASSVNVLCGFTQDERIARERLQPTVPPMPARNDAPAGAVPQPATNATEGSDDGWLHRGQTGNDSANPDADEEVWVRGDAE